MRAAITITLRSALLDRLYYEMKASLNKTKPGKT
jgi:hypothetical protein